MIDDRWEIPPHLRLICKICNKLSLRQDVYETSSSTFGKHAIAHNACCTYACKRTSCAASQREQSWRCFPQYGLPKGHCVSHRRSLSTHEDFQQIVANLFQHTPVPPVSGESNACNVLAPQWRKRLLGLNRPSARDMVQLLDCRNPTGLETIINSILNFNS